MKKMVSIALVLLPLVNVTLTSCSEKDPDSFTTNIEEMSQKQVCLKIINCINSVIFISEFELETLNKNIERNIVEFHQCGGAKLTAADKAELEAMAYSAGAELGTKIRMYAPYDANTMAQINRLFANLQRFDALLAN